ncbi:MAG TPA: hypothetical protein VJT67_00245 [Longimicrobiaceae bacterium]|nr:hypothetical protein [Longimicrobiaceae bacterium]
MTGAVRVAVCGVALALALGGCKRDDDTGATNLGPVHIDTANNTPMDGMSDEQLKRQAQALTPEQAAAAGMPVDTTIHEENLGSSDSTSSDTTARAAKQ